MYNWFNINSKVNISILLTCFWWSLWFISIHLAHPCKVLITNFEQVFAHYIAAVLVSRFFFCKFSLFQATAPFLYSHFLMFSGAIEKENWSKWVNTLPWCFYTSFQHAVVCVEYFEWLMSNMWNMFKVNKKDTKTTHWRRSGVFIVNFEQNSQFVLVFQLLTLNK